MFVFTMRKGLTWAACACAMCLVTLKGRGGILNLGSVGSSCMTSWMFGYGFTRVCEVGLVVTWDNASSFVANECCDPANLLLMRFLVGFGLFVVRLFVIVKSALRAAFLLNFALGGRVGESRSYTLLCSLLLCVLCDAGAGMRLFE